jgi:hypothetical protein
MLDFAVWMLVFVLIAVDYFVLGLAVTRDHTDYDAISAKTRWQDTVKRALIWPMIFFCLLLLPVAAIAATPSDVAVTSTPDTSGRVQVNWKWPKNHDPNLVKYRFRCSTINSSPLPIYIDIPANVPISPDFVLVMRLAPTPTYCCMSSVNNMGLESPCSTPLTVLPAFLPPPALPEVKATIQGPAPK